MQYLVIEESQNILQMRMTPKYPLLLSPFHGACRAFSAKQLATSDEQSQEQGPQWYCLSDISFHCLLLSAGSVNACSHVE